MGFAHAACNGVGIACGILGATDDGGVHRNQNIAAGLIATQGDMALAHDDGPGLDFQGIAGCIAAVGGNGHAGQGHRNMVKDTLGADGTGHTGSTVGAGHRLGNDHLTVSGIHVVTNAQEACGSAAADLADTGIDTDQGGIDAIAKNTRSDTGGTEASADCYIGDRGIGRAAEGAALCITCQTGCNVCTGIQVLDGNDQLIADRIDRMTQYAACVDRFIDLQGAVHGNTTTSDGTLGVADQATGVGGGQGDSLVLGGGHGAVTDGADGVAGQ